MKPFAYQYIDAGYDGLEANIVRPTVCAVYEQTIKRGDAPAIDALYPDGSVKHIPIKWFKKRIKLDRKAIRKEAEADIRAAVKWWDEYQAKLAARDPKEPPHLVTGCGPWGPPDTNVKTRVAQIVAERQWGWKTPEEIDWAALEASL